MAQLTKRNKTYFVYITHFQNGKQTRTHTFNLGKTDKETALKWKKQIERVENDIKSGIIKEWEFAEHFDWLSDDRNEINNRTLAGCIDEFMAYKKVNVRLSSWNRIRNTMDSFLDMYAKKTPIEEFKTKHINQFEMHHINRLSRAGVNLHKRNLKTFFRWCYEMEYINRVPSIRITQLDTDPKYISEYNLKRIFEALPKNYADIYKVFLETGKRRSELIEGELIGDLLIIPVKEGLKTKKEHSIKLDQFQKDTIIMFHKMRDDFIANGFDLVNFKHKIGKIFSHTCKNLNIDASLHSLRHTQAVITYQETGDILEVKRKLNHRKSTTSENYSKIDENVRELDFPQASKIALEVEKLRKNGIKHQNYTQNNEFN